MMKFNSAGSVLKAQSFARVSFQKQVKRSVQRLAPILVLTAVACLPSSNAFDPSGSPDSLAPTFVTGQVLFDDGSPVEGVRVDIFRLSGSDGGQQERVTATFLATAEQNSFSFEVPPDVTRVVVNPSRCGYSAVTYLIPDEYPNFATNLTPGSTFRINGGNPVTLTRDPPSRRVTGRVEALDETASESGIEIRLVEISPQDLGCTNKTLGETTTDADGTFSIDPVSDGLFVAVAFTEGTSVAISPIIDSCETPAADDVEVPLLAIRGSAGAIALTPVNNDGSLPAGVINEGRVNVTVGGFFDWATEMRLSEDPTEGGGSSGWIPVQSPRIFPSNGTLQGNTNTTLYARFRSKCARSPLYSASVIFDPAPPALSVVRLLDVDTSFRDGTVEGGNLASGWYGEAPVVVDELVTIPIAVDGFDQTGIQGEVVISELNGDVLSVQMLTPVIGGGLLSLRDQIDIPLAEGRYLVEATFVDGAGNFVLDEMSVEGAPRVYRWDLIRDTSPPTTPVPAVSLMEVNAEVALVWLEERPCLGGPPALVCEANKPDANFFQVRGGALLDFVGFDNPPFIVPLLEGENEIEIRAVDLAGNPSESTARLTIQRTSQREIARLPPEYILGGAPGQQLAATNGVAVFRATPNPANAPATDYEYLIAQPVDLAPVGLDAFSSPFASGIRKLSTRCCATSVHAFGPHAANGGRIGWLEGRDLNALGFPSSRARLWMSSLDADARIPIAVEAVVASNGQPAVDEEGDVSHIPGPEYCRTQAHARCSQTVSWRWQEQAEPVALDFSNSVAAISGTAISSIETIDGPTLQTIEVVGPKIVANIVDMGNADTKLYLGVELPVTLSAGTILGSDILTPGSTTYISAGDNKPVYREVNGSGIEVLRFNGGGSLGVPGNSDGSLIGILVPDGVTATFEVVSLVDNADAGVADAGVEEPSPLLPRGYVVADFDSFLAFSQYTRLTVSADEINGLTVFDAAIRMKLLRADHSIDGEGTVTGITLVDFGNNRVVDPMEISTLELDGALANAEVDSEWVALADQRSAVEVAMTLEDNSDLVLPEFGCTNIVEVKETVRLREIEFEGQGRLDEIELFVYRRDEGLLGQYERAPVFVGNTNRIKFRRPPELTPPGCGNNVEATQTFQEVVTVEPVVPQVTTLALTGDVNATFTGTALLATETQLGTLALGPGEEVVVKMEGLSAGDADLYLRLGSEPTAQDNDCQSESNGSSETCRVRASPFGGGTTVYVMAVGTDADVDVEVKLAIVQQVQQITVPPGQNIDVTTLGTGNLDLWINFGAAAMPSQNDDSSTGNTANESTSERTDEDSEVLYVGVAYFEPTTADLDVSFTPQLITIGSWPVVSGERVITAVSGQPSSVDLYLEFDQAPTRYDYRTRDTFPPLTLTRNASGLAQPLSDVFLAVTPEANAYDITIDVEIQTFGCELVRSEVPGASQPPSGNAILNPGTYAFVLGRIIEETSPTFQFPPSQPRIRKSTPAPENDVFAFHGSSDNVTINLGGITVGSVDASTGCDMTLLASSLGQLDSVAVSDSLWVSTVVRRTAVAAPQWSLEVGRVDDLKNAPALGGASAFTQDLGLRRVLHLEADDDAVLWVEAEPDGSQPRVWELPASELQAATPVPCLILDVENLAGPFAASAVTVNSGAIHLAGVNSVGPSLLSYARAAPGSCLPATFAGDTSLASAPQAIASDVDDLFLAFDAVSPAEGPTLHHIERQAFSPIFAGGLQEVSSFDLGANRLAFSLSSRLTGANHRLVVMDLDDGAFDGVNVRARVLSGADVIMHPTFLDDDRLAVVTGSAGTAPTLEIWNLAPLDDDEAVERINVPAATATLALAGVYDPTSPLRWSQRISLRRAGDGLAIVVHDGNAGEVAIIESIGTVPADWAQLAPDTASLNTVGTVRGVDAALAEVLVIYADGQSDWFRDAGGFAVLHHDGISRRFVGLTASGQLSLEVPNDLYNLKPPAFARLQRGRPDVDPSSYIDVGRMPPFSVDHAFSGAHEIGSNIFLQDESAFPPVIWRVDVTTGSVDAADGARRPLVSGDEALGPNARAQPLAGGGFIFVKRTQAGNGLFAVRPR